MAEAFRRLTRFGEAEACFRQAIRIDGDYIEPLSNLANMLAELGRSEESEHLYRVALSKRPGDLQLGWNLSLLLLRKGHYPEGFRLYEARFEAADRKALGAARKILEHLARYPRWQGEALRGQRLLVWTEQGLGDTLMMARYMRLLKELGAGTVTLYCEETLLRLMSCVPGVDRVASRKLAPPFGDFDLHCPIMSLPLLVDPDLSRSFQAAPGASIPDAVARTWRERLSSLGPLRIGINWASGRLSTVGALRDIPLRKLEPLIALGGAAFISLQKGEESRQLRELGWPIVDVMDQCHDLLDTAALMSQLDLIISVDTMIPHLAGLIGKPVWLLNRFESDWRWMRDGREASAWYSSMVLFTQKRRGDWDEVVANVTAELSRFIQRHHDDASDPAGFRVQQGLVHHRQGRLDEARRLYDAALTLVPTHPDALNLRGVIAHQLGQSQLALELLSRAVALAPESADFHNNLGEAYRGAGSPDGAEKHYRKAISLRPAYAEAHSNLGDTLRALGRLVEAEVCYRQAVALNASLAFTQAGLGSMLLEAGRCEEAAPHLSRAAVLMPGSAGAHYLLGSALRQTRRYGEAEHAYRRAVEIDPGHVDAHNSLGAVCRVLGRYSEAIRCYQRALALSPDNADAHNNLGNALKDVGDSAAADASFRRALEIRPGWPEAELNRSLSLLLDGQYERGFELYESRFRAGEKGVARVSSPIQERVQKLERCDSAHLRGKRVVVWTEQGLGDSIMMMRYLPLFRSKKVSRLLVHCEPELARLMQCVKGVDEVITDLSDLPTRSLDCHSPFMSFPWLFRTRLETVPNEVPYLRVPTDVLKAWERKTSNLAGWRVGLVWTGQPKLQDDRRRSVPLRSLRPLSSVAGVTFVSLQKGDGARELERSDGRIVDWMGDCTDLLDTAGLVQQLDLVIAVDTSVAHLAAALGKPVWLLCRFESEWRWLRDREDSPWYPNVRIFRQPRPGDWTPVVERIRRTLEELTASTGA
jgi:tetratricopeptide (TPR) repeat protein